MSEVPTPESHQQQQPLTGNELPPYVEGFKPDAVDDSEPLVRKATVHQPRNGEYADVIITPSKWRRVNVPNQNGLYTPDADRGPRVTADVERTASLRRIEQTQSEGDEAQKTTGTDPGVSKDVSTEAAIAPEPEPEPLQIVPSTAATTAMPSTLSTPPIIATTTPTPPPTASTNPFILPKSPTPPPPVQNDTTNPFLQKSPPSKPTPSTSTPVAHAYDDRNNPFIARTEETSTSPAFSPITSPKLSPTPSPSGSTSSRESSTTPTTGQVYKIKKHSLSDPYTLDIFERRSNKLVFSKLQRYTYSWGFASALVLPGGNNNAHEHDEGSEEDLKEEKDKYVVASARRAAYQKEIVLSCYPSHFPDADSAKNEEEKKTTTTLVRTSESTVLFTYEFKFEGRTCRWERKTISHDITLELVPDLAPSSTVSTVLSSKSTKEPRQNKTLAMLDSNAMGYLRSIGKLIILPQDGEGLWHDPQAFEAITLLTACILVDLMREVVYAAVGGPTGGVAGTSTGAIGKDIGGLVGFSLGGF